VCIQAGITAGIGLESNVNFEPDNVASREILDRQTPNSEVCVLSSGTHLERGFGPASL
jgi:hypothetical protein